MNLKTKLVLKFMNLLIKKGKKSRATMVLMKTLFLLKKKTKKNPINLMYSVIKKLTPGVTTKKTVIAGRLYHLPSAITTNKSLYFGCNWLQEAATTTKEGKSLSLSQKLSSECLRILSKKGQALALLKQHNKSVSENRPFLRFVKKKFKPRLPRKVYLKKKQLIFLKTKKKKFKRKESYSYEFRKTLSGNNNNLKPRKNFFKSIVIPKETHATAGRILFNIEKRKNRSIKKLKKKNKLPLTEAQKKEKLSRLRKIYSKYDKRLRQQKQPKPKQKRKYYNNKKNKTTFNKNKI